MQNTECGKVKLVKHAYRCQILSPTREIGNPTNEQTMTLVDKASANQINSKPKKNTQTMNRSDKGIHTPRKDIKIH